MPPEGPPYPDWIDTYPPDAWWRALVLEAWRVASDRDLHPDHFQRWAETHAYQDEG
jgi:hypothetical protein